ncbi:MAG: hypothetical protein AAF333_16080 [Planctomycetota bacterium]
MAEHRRRKADAVRGGVVAGFFGLLLFEVVVGMAAILTGTALLGVGGWVLGGALLTAWVGCVWWGAWWGYRHGTRWRPEDTGLSSTRPRYDPRACRRCGYNLHGSGSPTCPECGEALRPAQRIHRDRHRPTGL